MPTPRPVEFRSVKQLVRRLHANREREAAQLISSDDADVPGWQRQIVWTDVDMGLLIYSILRGYPIGQLILWKKPNGIRVPIDGRQRLTAIKRFAEGHIGIPSLRHVPAEFHGKKYTTAAGEPDHLLLSVELRDIFDDYEPSIVEYEDIEENTAKDIFVKLQGGKSLNKAEVRAALPGLVTDFVSDMTAVPGNLGEGDDDQEEETPSRHPFFAEVNVPNRRKAHRNLCDVLLHEYLYPGQDKHWSSLESMYLDKGGTLTPRERDGFRNELNRFHGDVQREVGGERRVDPKLKSAFLILSYFRVWRELKKYAMGNDYSFLEEIQDFETLRQNQANTIPYVNFNAALSNAGYALHRSKERHAILMSHILRRHPNATPRDQQRAFTDEQKIAIWDRAKGRCEFEENGQRCIEEFVDFRAADADHIVRWIDGGATSLENGRLLCATHNRGRR
jgi:Protein of unknown function DUF262/HNH endonuclease